MDSGKEKEKEGPKVVRDIAKSIDRTRRSVILAYWTVFFLALPLWWYTTSIQRLSLPAARVLALADTELRLPVNVKIDTQNTAFIREIERGLSEESLSGLQVNVHGREQQSDPRTAYTVVHAPGISKVWKRMISFPFDDDNSSKSASRLSSLISSILLPRSTVPSQVQQAVQYAPRYRLAFSLLNENAASGVAVTNWDISQAISRYLSPILDNLSILHNFTIESQVQFHAPLAFNPISLAGGGYGISRTDLTVFVNSAEWTLSSSISNDPVLHFILFIPSALRQPLHILDADGTPSPSTAFLVPQWGGIVIYNLPSNTDSQLQLSSTQLEPIFSSFSNQLLTLLGVPKLPPGVYVNVTDDETPILTDWQLDALLRQRILENVRHSKDTLLSIVKLVEQIKSMPVGRDVKNDVNGASKALDNVFSVSRTFLPLALLESSQAITLASRAFFNPGMLALLYSPAEHKYAVYTPLFASALIPLIGAAMREVSAWRRSRKQRRDEASQTSDRTEALGKDVKSD